MRIIAMDGCERTGKSTQIQLLKLYLEGKGFKVYTCHTSLLEQKDVTHMKISREARFFAYMAALMEVTMKIRIIPCDYVLLDRYILTHIVYSKKYWSPHFQKYNDQFTNHLFELLRNTPPTTLCFLYPYMRDKSYDPDLITYFVNAELPGLEKITIQASKSDVHEHIKKLMQV